MASAWYVTTMKLARVITGTRVTDEELYVFTDVETLVADFLADIARVRRGGA
jgi:hypothetical protein